VKEFVVYTGLRLLMFAATFGVVIGAWVLVGDRANVAVAVVIAFVVSGLGSYFLLSTGSARRWPGASSSAPHGPPRPSTSGRPRRTPSRAR